MVPASVGSKFSGVGPAPLVDKDKPPGPVPATLEPEPAPPGPPPTELTDAVDPPWVPVTRPLLMPRIPAIPDFACNRSTSAMSRLRRWMAHTPLFWLAGRRANPTLPA